jgi:hypothetical protein
MSDQVELFYVKTNLAVFYFTDITRKSLIEESLKQLFDYQKSVISRQQFERHPGIQRILREVPECRASYQKHIRQSVKFDSHTPMSHSHI